MNYDENVFKAKANIKARRIWLVFSLLLTANYGADMSNGLYPSKQYLYFVLLCWIPFFIGELFLKIKGKTTDIYRYILVLGYGIFYTYLLCTTASPIAFTYILPVTSLLIIFKDRKFMLQCGIANTISVVISIIYRYMVLSCTTATDVKNYQLQISCLILCYICYIINFIDITPRFLPVFAEKFSFEYLRKSHKIPLFSNKLVTDYIRALTLACTAA